LLLISRRDLLSRRWWRMLVSMLLRAGLDYSRLHSVAAAALSRAYRYNPGTYRIATALLWWLRRRRWRRRNSVGRLTSRLSLRVSAVGVEIDEVTVIRVSHVEGGGLSLGKVGEETAKMGARFLDRKGAGCRLLSRLVALTWTMAEATVDKDESDRSRAF
jgi:hypothetical protein